MTDIETALMIKNMARETVRQMSVKNTDSEEKFRRALAGFKDDFKFSNTGNGLLISWRGGASLQEVGQVLKREGLTGWATRRFN